MGFSIFRFLEDREWVFGKHKFAKYCFLRLHLFENLDFSISEFLNVAIFENHDSSTYKVLSCSLFRTCRCINILIFHVFNFSIFRKQWILKIIIVAFRNCSKQWNYQFMDVSFIRLFEIREFSKHRFRTFAFFFENIVVSEYGFSNLSMFEKPWILKMLHVRTLRFSDNMILPNYMFLLLWICEIANCRNPAKNNTNQKLLQIVTRCGLILIIDTTD